MATVEMGFLHDQLAERKRRLTSAIALAPHDAGMAALLREVDAALDRFDAGTYGLCDVCHESVEHDRLLADPLVRFCLAHLNQIERAGLQRDLDLAAELQRRLLPPADLFAAGWETSYHYAPLGPVSGDYCDLCPSDGDLFFALGDVSGKGVAASLRMTQLHALFRSLIGMGLEPAELVAHINRFLCDSALAGQYATLICGHAHATGCVELFNAGHLPAIAVRQGRVQRLESTSLPLGMFKDARFTPARVQMNPGDMLFLFTDGLSEARIEEEEYGLDRIADLVASKSPCTAAGLISACLEDVRAFVGPNPGLDDLTLLALRRSE